jgi:alpha-ketoglutarate-dependent taurine dioxygenase
MNDQHSNEPSIAAIKAAVCETGLCHVSQGWSEARFRALCEEFGEVFYEAEVKLGGDRPRNYQLPQAIGFHTDHVSAEYVAWYCYVPEPDGGAMQFLDLGRVYESLAAAHRQALGRVGVTDNAAWGGGEPIALCAASPRGGNRIHYVSWLDMFPADADAAAALEAFEAGVKAAARSAVVECALRPGDVVVLDNHRVAHGRRAIAGESRRHLKRLWMRSAGGHGGPA